MDLFILALSLEEGFDIIYIIYELSFWIGGAALLYSQD